MSDSLTSLTTLTSGVPLLGGLSAALAAQLAMASWRGIAFYMVTGEENAGQRAVKFAYPGRPKADFQFLGGFDGPMLMDGMVIGSDCVRQALKLRAACQKGAKGRLVHPWYGSMDAVLTERARFSFNEQEFGMVRFSATFERYLPVAPPKPDWFGRLQDAVDGLMSQARSLLAQVMGVLSVPLALYSFASGLFQTAVGIWDGLGLGAGGTAVAAATAAGTLALAIAAPPNDDSFAGTVADLLAAPALDLANASQPPEQSAIGAGPTADLSPQAIDPADAAAALLSAAASFASPSLTAGAVPGVVAIALAAQMQVVAQAAAVGATISFDSTDAAAVWRDQLGTALAALQGQAAQLATVLPLPAGAAWRAIDTLRVAAIADCNTRMVNLPALQSIVTDRSMDAWAIALTLFGDTPELMANAVIDLWRRNALGNPASVPAGTYALLA